MAAVAIENALARDSYTVGWVCALPTEQVAAIAMLDQRHASLPRFPNDDNVYSLGSIGEHNIVIACLPKGRIGKTSAAIVAMDMAKTFPSIRISLMVGVGGGIPSNKVRLGDVVVSVPDGPYPGVVQWDMGKATDGGKFERTGALDKPPATLLNAISKLETEHKLHGSNILTYLQEAEDKFPALVGTLLRSSELRDVLFKKGYSHVEKPGGADDEDDECDEADEYEDCSFCDKNQTIKRKDRAMQIHYGIIASGDQVIKDASFREQLNKELGGKVLCVEMEAAGLMDRFPCMVIRGICDYADSHKNKAWQEHAAAIAAAFAKELLLHIPISDIQMERTIKDSLSSLSQDLSTIKKDMAFTKSWVRDEEGEKILDWLTKHDYGLQYSDLLKRRQQGTGQWLLDSTEYQSWREETSNQTLFCPGIPGAGKTILAAIIIDDLRKTFTDDRARIAYIFCNFRRGDDQTLDNLILSLLKQFVQVRQDIPESLKVLYESHKRERTRPSNDELLAVLSSLAEESSRLFIVIDALDECQISQNCRNAFLDELFSLQKKTGLNLCATSRYIPEIEERFRDCTLLRIQAKTDDIQRFLHSQVSELPQSFITKNRMFQEKIYSKIIAAADGMFLLAKLHLDSLQGLWSENELLAALNGLAQGSNAYAIAYKSAMDRIKHQIAGSAKLAERILAWIIYTRRPLTLDELRAAVSITEGALYFDNGDLVQADMVSICAGLVTVDEESNIIRLIHFTVQEYFEGTKAEFFPDAQLAITKACMTYLSFQDFGNGACHTDDDIEWRLESYPFYDYAARNWGYHAYNIDDYQILQPFLKKKAQVEASYQVLVSEEDVNNFPRAIQGNPPERTSLHLAAIFGLETVVEAEKDEWVQEPKDHHGRTPLSRAAENGHYVVVKLLLEAGDEVNSMDINDQTPLWWAAAQGHEAVVKLLLKAGAKVSSMDRQNRTALLCAAVEGHEAVVKLLLKAGAEVDSMDLWRWTPLLRAASQGHKAVVKLLLEAGAEVDSKDRNHRTPLLRAASQGHKAVVKLLLEAGAEVDSKDRNHRTPLSRVAEQGHEAVVKFLLKAGAEVNSIDRLDRAPLLWATMKGHEAVVKLLLEAGAKVNSIDRQHQTPLFQAAIKGHEAIVKLLLEAGAEVDLIDVWNWTPL